MASGPVQNNSGGPDLKSLGLNSPLEVIDILGAMKIDGRPVITDDKAHLNPTVKAETVVKFFTENFNMKPSELPHLASVVKRDLQAGKLDWKA
ncbi:MAG: hypothetical protein MUC35_01225 [Candidatus Margulisbacteria bacterium]|jgi:hypothetical protein|nr:hypothetical protein [Candidatus Margulisiibacteriota bacterium]